MNTRLLRYFITAAECGSFTATAEKLYTNQPNVSRQIALLEQSLGTSLFHRAHRSVTLTPAGQRFYTLIRDIPDRLDAAAEELQRMQRQQANTLRLGILDGHLLSPALMQNITRFGELHPEASLTMSRGEFSDLLTQLEKGSLDIIFTILFTVQPGQQLETRLLQRQRTMVAVPKRNPLSSRDSLCWSDLANQHFLVLEEGPSPVSYENIRNYLAPLGLQSSQIRPVPSTEALFTSTESNLGIAIVDEGNRLMNSPYVNLIPLNEVTSAPDFGAVWKNHATSGLLKSFVTLLDEVD